MSSRHYSRHLVLEKGESHLLLGARGTGKSTLVNSQIPQDKTFSIDLLKPSEEDRLSQDPELLIRLVKQLPPAVTHVFIDEIQKVPSLLDVVHHLIEKTNRKFILTGSSARKLKRGSANLLAGRALAQFLFPLTSFELGEDFDLKKALSYGTLPKVWASSSERSQRKFLETYALIYLKEEVQLEQIVRVIDPFRKFLFVAAQVNGKPLNFDAIARDVGVDGKTVKNYFQILEDTLLGFFLEAFDTSVRKRLRKAPKFFFFDVGVARALARQLTVPLSPGSYAWGDAFEHFLLTEMKRLSAYSGNQFEFSYIRSERDVEIDVICERPGQTQLMIEIKSTTKITAEDTKSLSTLGREISPKAELVVFSNDPIEQKLGGVLCLPWQEGLARFFTGPDISDFRAPPR